MSRKWAWGIPGLIHPELFLLASLRGVLFHLVLVPLLVVLSCLMAGGGLSATTVFFGVAGGLAVLGSGLMQLHTASKALRRSSILDEQLMQSRKMAAIGEMSSGIAHEINTPLGVITQEVEWLRHLAQEKGIGAEEEFKDSLDQIESQVARCTEITHGMLNFARAMHLVEQRTDVNRLVEDMVRWVEREAVERNIHFERRYDALLPEIGTDAPMLRHVVLNLLNNATQAVDHDGTVIVTTARNDADHILIQVADTGPGIPQEHLESIFHPFFTTKPPGKGTGLGLSICLSIVTKLGGTIKVESKLGKGATFTVRLPFGQAQAKGPETSKNAENPKHLGQ
ncbi:two-component sensor histidine kinase [Oceanidesulfovibrio indonesiensis]|uniref:histidine kinase n=1 Tax=Oceanidesulfovibrio indonesiensis TaxID=54767 RepID=A0A7M3MAX4_9BACT|nr:ATP-binding protein [Oceanidesulfovibrio indonesiensis]TVM14581.1 two-component sensor histidine kinase [Oceanidesulfovibrio indonesiensis]